MKRSLFIILCLVMLFPGFGFSGQITKKPLVILADVSGSMQDKVEIVYKKDNKEKKEKISKVDLMKRILVKLTKGLDSNIRKTDVIRFRHQPGNKSFYTCFFKNEDQDIKELSEKIEDEFDTDYPVFNRRTPIGDMLRQLDEKVLDSVKGNVTLVLISDGFETFYDLENDARYSLSDKFNIDDDIKGPLCEIRRLKEKYGDKISIHTVFMEKRSKEYKNNELALFFKKDENEIKREVDGEIVLKRMAYLGGGKSFSGEKIAENPELLKELKAFLWQKN